jgi:hypothetical protein
MIRMLSRRNRRGLIAAAFAAGLAALPAVPAMAATLSLVGGTTTSLPTGCSTGAFNPVNFCGSNAAKTAYLGLDPDAVMRPGSTVKKISAAAKNANPSYGLVLDGKARVTFTYMLKEAAYTNVLAETTAGWNQLFSTASTPIGTQSASVVMGPGLLAFTLKTLGQALAFANDGTAQGKVSLAFSKIFNKGRSVIVGYDDSGAGPDKDYDDLVARIDVAPVPLPAAAWLLVAGLGLGLAARRRPAQA